MQYSKFMSDTCGELLISKLGMGCMRLPVKVPGEEEIDYDRAAEVIDYAYSHGVNYFDTAMGYHEMGSEPFVGYALEKYPRDSLFLATKLSTWFLSGGKSVDDIFNMQKERLRTDYFDFYLCHNMNDSTFKVIEDVDAYKTLTDYKKRGLIRNLGFSFHGSVELLEKLVSKYKWDFAQIQFNYLDTEYGTAMKEYEILEKAGIPTIVMEPVRGGSLANLCDGANSLLKTAEPDKSIASWGIRYAASQSNVFTTLSGMSNMEQVIDNVNTLSDFKPFGDSENELLREAAKLFKEYFTVPCTQCKYCMDTCPMKINVPELLKVYGRWKLDKDVPDFVEKYNKIDENERAEHCIGCASCEEKCPQKISIASIMNEMKELSEKFCS